MEKLSEHLTSSASSGKRISPPNDIENIYHCCVQKTGSQWIKKILSDSFIYERSGLKIYTPKKDFILDIEKRQALSKQFPEYTIISPLYIVYDDFEKMPKPEKYKAFWVMRDPRDLIISRYFSTKYSHALLNEILASQRKQLLEMSLEEGIMMYIKMIGKEHKILYSSLTSWMKALDNENVLLCRYEDMIEENKAPTFMKIFKHCDIRLSIEEVENLLHRFSFKKISRRDRGDGDHKSHYRKGISGDWKNYFTDEHKSAFKELAGQLLIELGYEGDLNW
jgi:hypothetical protein